MSEEFQCIGHGLWTLTRQDENGHDKTICAVEFSNSELVSIRIDERMGVPQCKALIKLLASFDDDHNPDKTVQCPKCKAWVRPGQLHTAPDPYASEMRGGRYHRDTVRRVPVGIEASDMNHTDDGWEAPDFEFSDSEGRRYVGRKPKITEPTVISKSYIFNPEDYGMIRIGHFTPSQNIDFRKEGHIVHLATGFFRIGFFPHRFMLVRSDKALFTIRQHGWKIGNWYLVLGH